MTMVITTRPRSLHKVTIDIQGILLIALEENRYILTIYGNMSKYLVAVPIKDQTSEVGAEAVVDHFIS